MSKLLNVMKKKKAVFFEKPSGTIAVVGDMNLMQRKLYNIFLLVAKEDLEKDISIDYHSVTLSELIKVLGLIKPNKQRLKNIIRDLVDIKLEYNYLKKDNDVWGISSMLNDIEVEFNEEMYRTTINFAIPRIVRKAFIKRKSFAKINLVITNRMRSKYSNVLYELLEDYKKVQFPTITIEELKDLIGVKDKYKRIVDLKKYALDPAIKEINIDPDIDFKVKYKLIKNGRTYTHIKFSMKQKNIKPAELEFKKQDKVIEAEVKENKEIKELLVLIPGEYRRKEKVIYLILGSVETKGKEYTKAQIEYVIRKYENGKIKNFVAYLKQAIEKDYASIEELDLGPDVVKPDDAVGYEGESIGKPGTKIRILSVEEKENEEIYIVSVKNMNTNEVVWVEVEKDRIMEYAKQNIEMKQEDNIL